MRITITPELRSFAGDEGGSLFVDCRRVRGCRGVAVLYVTTREPPSWAQDELFLVDGVLVHARLPVRLRPRELHLSLEGRRRPAATWDGCAFVI